MQEIDKVVIIGPESTGKSTLCTQLAAHYKTLWCPEFARDYLLLHGTNYTFNDLLTIARGQLELEQEYTKKVIELWKRNGETTRKPLLFIDTDMYVMKVWCEFVFNNCHQFIVDEIVRSRCSLYFLCNTDLPWVRDELREYPDLTSREKLFHMYQDILINQTTPWVKISGNYDERFLNAINAIEEIILP